MCHLLPGKEPKDSYSISNVALRNKPGNHLGRDGTETSRDGIFNQSSLTCRVMCDRENFQNIVTQFLMLYYVSTWRTNKGTYVKVGVCHHTKR